jgi:hypothetical protein
LYLHCPPLKQMHHMGASFQKMDMNAALRTG